MNRNLWKNRRFDNQNPISYPCPNCEIGILKSVKILRKITKQGIELQQNGYPYGIPHIFSGLLECKNCSEILSFGGELGLDYEYHENLSGGGHETTRVNIYEPKFFFPNLKLFKIPNEISDNVKEQINLSFSHYFNDLSSCANRVRTAVELLLNDIKAPKYRFTNAGNKHTFKNLHNRIENFRKKKKTIADLLLAIKFIGNEGSHVGKVETEDILDAYEILYEVFDIVYIKKRKKVMQIAKEINESKKPRSKR